MLLIKNGYMMDPKSGKDGNYDILTEKDRIQRIGKSLVPPAGCKVIDAEGLLVAPASVQVGASLPLVRAASCASYEHWETGRVSIKTCLSSSQILSPKREFLPSRHQECPATPTATMCSRSL